MESQIEALEVRMQRREKELMSAVEEAKASAAVERSRLEALHAQVRRCCCCRLCSEVYRRALQHGWRLFF